MSEDRKAYWDKRLRENAGLGGVGQISHSLSWNDRVYRLKEKVLRRVVRRIPVDLRTARVLDVGSGTGFGVGFWRRSGVEDVSGSDLSDVAVENLGRQFPATRFLQLDIGDEVVHVPGAPFDVVSAFEVLFHIVDDARFDRALRNVHDLLRPGGYLVFSDNFLRHRELRAPHQVCRTEAAILDALRDAGLRPLHRSPMLVLMGSPVDTRTDRPRRIWRRSVGRVARSARWAGPAGVVLGSVDAVLTRLLRQGPSVEVMVCQRVTETATTAA